MSETFKPRNDKETAELVRWAHDHETPLEIIGHGTKRGFGRPLDMDHVLDMSSLSGIDLYEPEELVLRAGAGTPLAEIEAALAENSQQLAFEPADYGPLYGEPAGHATIGGVIAANLSGPRRIRAGAARDHLLGFEAVNGTGERFKSGGRVMKNVSGYDLCKIMAGSWGTLAALTQLTVKVLPAAETEATLLIENLDDERAVVAMIRAQSSALDITGAAFLPTSVAGQTGYAETGNESLTCLRLEGIGASVDHRCGQLKALLAEFGNSRIIEDKPSEILWSVIGDVTPFAADHERDLWRLGLPPASAAAVMADLDRAIRGSYFMDWGGALVWLMVDDVSAASAQVIRTAVSAHGGYATLVRADAGSRAQTGVFMPPAPPLLALSKRLKASFDPAPVFNPGRMYTGQ
jgi:glycolate oxidase FAD binding subunit